MVRVYSGHSKSHVLPKNLGLSFLHDAQSLGSRQFLKNACMFGRNYEICFDLRIARSALFISKDQHSEAAWWRYRISKVIIGRWRPDALAPVPKIRNPFYYVRFDV
jgi:hypothetical protein